MAASSAASAAATESAASFAAAFASFSALAAAAFASFSSAFAAFASALAAFAAAAASALAALADALDPDGQWGLRLKWPNDLWLGQAKLGGILIETAALGERRYAVVGVGINIKEPAPGWLPPVAGEAAAAAPAVAPAWLQSVVPVSAEQLLGALAPALVRDVLQFERQGWSAFAQRFARLDLLQGRTVGLSDGRQGLASGVSASGALRLQTPAGLVEVSSGEVSVRPQA